jgi:hypothetical protein
MEETVSKGEVCSIETAKNLKIDDIVENNVHYLTPYSDVMTYNEKIDNLDNTRQFMLCEPINNNIVAPVCALEAGFGFTKLRNPTTLEFDKCVTVECPDGFTTDGLKCIKPKIQKTVLKRNVIDERWYDWFMIPNYQLGNKYIRVDGVNYAPCDKNSVPSYSTDPVDNERKYLTSNEKDEVDKCIPKDTYFGGKYFTSETYCPIAWVYRAGATKENLEKMYKEKINALDSSEEGTPELDTLKNKLNTLIHSEIYDPIIDYGFNDNIRTPRSEDAKQACEILNNDPLKKENALLICSTIKDLGEDATINKFMKENQEDEKTAKKRYLRATQACHTLFCDDDEICFKNMLGKDIKEDEKKKTEEKPIDPVKYSKTVLDSTLKAVIIIVSVTFGAILLLLYFYKLHPHIYPFIKEKLNGLKGSVLGFFGFVA